MRRPLLLVLGVLVAALAWPAAAVALDRAGLQAKLGRELARAGAGGGAQVVDLTTGRVLFGTRADVARPPASVQKLFVTATALLRFGPGARLDTTVRARTTPDALGVVRGDLWLRGAGDPTLTTTRLGGLARQLAALGVRDVRGSVVGDGSAHDGLPGSYDSGGQRDGDIGGQLSALVVDRGFTRGGWQARPPLYAAQRLARALRLAGVRVLGRTRTGVTPAAALPLARTSSPPMRELAARTNVPSDNFFAELLLKDLGARFGARGSTAAGADVVADELSALGLEPTIADGSGLSRADRATPRQVVQLLAAMADSDLAATFRRSLAVPGRSGTLLRRMRGTAAAGRCAAKTGTLIGVSALAGYCPTRDRRTVAFAFLMSGVSTWTARSIQDRAAAAIAAATLG